METKHLLSYCSLFHGLTHFFPWFPLTSFFFFWYLKSDDFYNVVCSFIHLTFYHKDCPVSLGKVHTHICTLRILAYHPEKRKNIFFQLHPSHEAQTSSDNAGSLTPWATKGTPWKNISSSLIYRSCEECVVAKFVVKSPSPNDGTQDSRRSGALSGCTSYCSVVGGELISSSTSSPVVEPADLAAPPAFPACLCQERFCLESFMALTWNSPSHSFIFFFCQS